MIAEHRRVLKVASLVLLSAAVFGATTDLLGQSIWKSTPADRVSARQRDALDISTGDSVSEPASASGISPLSALPGGTAESGLPDGRLPAEEGQVWRGYDIRGYTNRLPSHPEPQRAIIDWILRETGSDIWFGATTSLLNGTRERIRVYHTPDVQRTVNEIIERYTQSHPESHALTVRFVTVENPNWRVMGLPLMQPVAVQTPGVQAWLVSRENAAWLMSALRQRNDFREYGSSNVTVLNGQTETMSSRRPVVLAPSSLGLGTIGLNVAPSAAPEEGFTLRIGSLLTKDRSHVDAVVQCDVDQLERVTAITMNPVPGSLGAPPVVHVPQMSSWQMHERFRWPVNEVLVVSRGVVAMPGAGNRVLGGLSDLVRANPPRADALLFLESQAEAESMSRRRAADVRTGSLNFRGRY